ncbi:EamA family transporter [Lacibacterium aquatile]|uniref:EamA family transporter n=1 Tax=Lacibacterium aquatile TaxID=1168082 RepID=A0ABW5DJZ7_9PROT
MPLQHILLALLVTTIWGVNFVVIKVGLDGFPPLLFCALRFALAALPLIFLRGPMPAPFKKILLIGVLLGVIKFGLLFTSIKIGMPAGLSSLVLQSQVFFTILIAGVFLGERPKPRALIGLAIAAGGLLLIGLERPMGNSLIAFLMAIASALTWAFANIATKKSGATDMLRLISWVSLIPPLPLLALSYFIEGGPAISHAIINITWTGVGALLFIAFLATTLCFAIWSFLLQRYPAAVVTPFALTVPISGLLSAWIFLGEALDMDTVIACALVFVGLAVTVLPGRSGPKTASTTPQPVR